MPQSDLVARLAAALEIAVVLFNLLMTFIWFISLIWVLLGAFWCLVGLAVLLEGCVAAFVLVRGYTPIGFIGPVIGVGASVLNLNFMAMAGSVLVLMMYGVAAYLRSQEDAESEEA